MAVFYDGELTDSRVRTFYGKWTDKKRGDINNTVRRTVVRYRITDVSVKTPIPAYCSQNMNDLLSDIQLLSVESRIKLTVCTVARLKEHCGGNNKLELSREIIRKYPEHQKLAALLAPKKEHRNAYHVKLFEAIACAEIELGTRK
jgi:hypothetical protein